MHTLTKLEINPLHEIDACVILMHGLGDSAQGLKPLVDALGLPEQSRIKFILPDAPMRPITINQGVSMRGWYDIKDINLAASSDMDAILGSEAHIKDLIQTQIDAGIPSERIILAGFSQGGVMALHTGLKFPQRLGGILALSCYLPLFDALPEGYAPIQTQTPIDIQHGVYDQIVPLQAGKMAYATLKEAGYNVSWSEYFVEHSIDAQQIYTIRHWLLQHLD
tara:strand:- start:725 stop:1390 length:666 start_codon:yes stop_codon:yes gene_type:complete